MFYPVLGTLLQDNNLSLATASDIEKLDEYLAGLSVGQANQVSPWRVSNKTGISIKAIYEVFLYLAKKGTLRIKYELWHPESRIKVHETFDKSELEHSEDFDEEEELPPDYVLREEDVIISFRLDKIIGNETLSKKKTLKFFSRKPSSQFSFI